MGEKRLARNIARLFYLLLQRDVPRKPRQRTPAELERLRAIMAWLRQFLAEHGRAPTNAELCAAMGWRSRRAAQKALASLRALGWLDWTTVRKRRIIRVTDAVQG